jgi:DNA-binding CsgD family transcriptional regulator
MSIPRIVRFHALYVDHSRHVSMVGTNHRRPPSPFVTRPTPAIAMASVALFRTITRAPRARRRSPGKCCNVLDWSRRLTTSRALRESYASLSRREREVMALVVSGLLNKQVGGQLGISEVTVKAHRGKLMRKMKADSLVELVRMAASLGLAPAAKG